jgi:hypothetical protein
MARLIEVTPILKGDDAKRFRQKLLDVVNAMANSTPEDKRKIEEERKEMKRCYDLMVSVADDVFY